ncbi:MAG: type II secretion system F family protein, partial [Candidatus Altiarchaeota archaeon]|nr:type II secretion system F family protein [Candidatus Altiarchaeota archaeon]
TAASKYGLKKALDMSGKRNRSRLYRRVVWQLQNSLETGADMGLSLKAVLEDLRKVQEYEAQRYGRSMEKKMIVYVIGAIVFPALSVVVIQTMGSLGLSEKLAGESSYWMILAFSVVTQLFFVFLVRVTKPALLTELNASYEGDLSVVGRVLSTLKYAGVKSPGKHLLASLIVSGFFGLIAAYYASGLLSVDFGLLFFSFTVACFVFLFFRKVCEARRRGVVAASHLPDSLRITASNIKAGLPIDQSLFMSAREDFPVLGSELKLMACDVMKNVSFEEAVEKTSERVRDSGLHLSLNLIAHGLRGGLGVADSLYHIADILQRREHMRQEVSAQLHSVKATVLLLVMFSAPILYGFSFVSTDVMSSFGRNISHSLPDEVMGRSWVKPMQAETGGFLDNYIVTNLFTTAFLGCLTIGFVSTGKILDGMKYFFPSAVVSVVTYVSSKAVLYSVFKGMLG